MSLSGGRESLLTREIEDLKSKLMTKTDELNEAIESNSEVCTLHKQWTLEYAYNNYIAVYSNYGHHSPVEGQGWQDQGTRNSVSGVDPPPFFALLILLIDSRILRTTDLLHMKRIVRLSWLKRQVCMIINPRPEGYGSCFVIHFVHCATESSAHFFAPVKVWQAEHVNGLQSDSWILLNCFCSQVMPGSATMDSSEDRNAHSWAGADLEKKIRGGTKENIHEMPIFCTSAPRLRLKLKKNWYNSLQLPRTCASSEAPAMSLPQ